jgi:hypothetical protein
MLIERLHNEAVRQLAAAQLVQERVIREQRQAEDLQAALDELHAAREVLAAAETQRANAEITAGEALKSVEVAKADRDATAKKEADLKAGAAKTEELRAAAERVKVTEH